MEDVSGRWWRGEFPGFGGNEIAAPRAVLLFVFHSREETQPICDRVAWAVRGPALPTSQRSQTRLLERPGTEMIPYRPPRLRGRP